MDDVIFFLLELANRALDERPGKTCTPKIFSVRLARRPAKLNSFDLSFLVVSADFSLFIFYFSALFFQFFSRKLFSFTELIDEQGGLQCLGSGHFPLSGRVYAS